MSAVADLIRAGWSSPCRPWPRHVLDPPQWRAMAAALAEAPAVELVALWADPQLVHALLRDRAGAAVLPVSVPVESGFYPALSRARPAAAWFERMIRDLWGHHAEDGLDGRPWLDHGAWALHAPLSARPVAVAGQPEPPEFAAPDGVSQYRIPLGPVLSGIGEPAQLRLTVAGERVVRLEARLGYAHKGTLALLRGKSPRAAARFAARLAGDATVAHGIAFARAAEAATAAEPPARAVALRAAMAELERIGCHLSDLAAIAEAVGFAPPGATLSRLREDVARAADAAFGHRLMMDCVLPGGVAGDLAADGADRLHALARQVAEALPDLRALFAAGTIAERLAGCAVLRPALAEALAVGGVVGRASGRTADLRRDIAEPPYDGHRFDLPATAATGDVAARVALRVAELGQSAALLQAVLLTLPSGPLRVDLPPATGEGIGWAEGARGDLWHWLRLEGGQIVAAFARDPGWTLWPALEAAAAGVAVADVPLLVASFGATVSGMDSVMSFRPATEPAAAIDADATQVLADRLAAAAQARLGRSLAIRPVAAGGCNGCEVELRLLASAVHDLERFGLSIVTSPRHADVLLVTGPVTRSMHEAVVRAWQATPDPKWVVAVGDCAIDGGVFRGSYAVAGGAEAALPVDLAIRGCPPTPTQLLEGLRCLLEANARR